METTELRRAIATYLETTVEDPSEAPSFEELAAYHEDRLDPAEKSRLRERIVGSPEAIETLLELERFDRPPDSRPVNEFQLVAMRQRIQRQVRLQNSGQSASEQSSPEQSSSPKPTSHKPSARGPVFLRLATAASFLLAATTLFLLFQVRDLTSRLDDALSPQANAMIVDLLSPQRGELTNDETVVQTNVAITFLLAPERPLRPAYHLDIVDSNAQVVRPINGLVPDKQGTLRVNVPPGALLPDQYLFRLMATVDESAVIVEEYSVRYVQP